MFDFIKQVGNAMKEGNRAGRVVNLLQKVIGRSLGSSERNTLKDFYDTMGYPDNVTESSVVMDYLCFLVQDGNSKWGALESPIMTPDAKGRLIECVEGAIAWGVLPPSSANDLKTMKSHVGISK